MPKDFDAWMEEPGYNRKPLMDGVRSLSEILEVDFKEIKRTQTHNGFMLEAEWDGKNLIPLKRMLEFLPKDSCLHWEDHDLGVISVVCPHETYTLHPNDIFTLSVVIT